MTKNTINCPICGNTKFRQSIIDSFSNYIDDENITISSDSDFDHDVEIGIIRCSKCEYDCTELFENIALK